MKVDIVVLNYNGAKLIPQCLPSIIEAQKRSAHFVRTVVVDNKSTDASLEVLNFFQKEIVVIKHDNRFLCSFNDVAEALISDVVILLNNDIKVDRDFIGPLVEVFQKYPDAFFAAPKVLTFDGKEENGATIARMRLGVFWSSAAPERQKEGMNIFSYTFSSGFAAFDRKKFVKLGGYDDLYLPGRFEDADLGLRAWKMGWRSYYEPLSVVYHLGQATFKEKFGERGIDAIDGRNIFLFMWKNYDAPALFRHILFLPLWCVRWALKGSFHYFKGFFAALGMISIVLKKRRAEKTKGYTMTTSGVFRFLSKNKVPNV